MKTNRAKILSYMKKVGFITKSIIAGYRWSYGAGDHIMKLRERHNILTVMNVNPKTKSRYATYYYMGELRE